MQIEVSTKPMKSDSDNSTVYLGTAPKIQQQTNEQPTKISRQPADPSTNVGTTASKQPRKVNKCKRTPAFKYPMSQKLDQALSNKQEPSVPPDSQNLPTNHGEMTSPDELYYVNTNNQQ